MTVAAALSTDPVLRTAIGLLGGACLAHAGGLFEVARVTRRRLSGWQEAQAIAGLLAGVTIIVAVIGYLG